MDLRIVAGVGLLAALACEGGPPTVPEAPDAPEPAVDPEPTASIPKRKPRETPTVRCDEWHGVAIPQGGRATACESAKAAFLHTGDRSDAVDAYAEAFEGEGWTRKKDSLFQKDVEVRIETQFRGEEGTEVRLRWIP